ncbi:protein kinase [Streptomyces sp. NPDC048275]|uniref:protein kinase n=1 Tax=Streptomyces sp. NPDC048275 TaxID=3155629 RepID=UPI0033C508C0
MANGIDQPSAGGGIVDDYAGRVLADRYRLPLPPSDEYEFAETRAFDTYSGQEVLVRQVPLPEVVEAEVLDADGLPEGFVARDGGVRRASARTTRRPTEPAVRRAIEAAQAAAQIPDHPRLDQVFDVFAEGGSLWIVSEFVPARPLAALLAEKPLSPYRAAEVAADVLTALRVLHAHGWVHRNITVRTVLVCDDGRVMLTGLAAGAAEEALCGYDPVPVPDFEGAEGPGGSGSSGGSGRAAGSGGSRGFGGEGGGGAGQVRNTGSLDAGAGPGRGVGAGAPGGGAPGVRAGASFGVVAASAHGADAEAARRAAIEARAENGAPVAEPPAGGGTDVGRRAPEAGDDVRAARAGAIAAYRAGARAAARVQEQQRGGPAALPAPRSVQQVGSSAPSAQGSGPGTEHQPEGPPPGQIADPYGVGQTSAWHGAQPRSGSGSAGGSGSGGGNGQGLPVLPGPVTGLSPIPGPVVGNGTPAPTPGQRQSSASALAPATPNGRWDELVAGAPPRRGPATALAAERARQARMAVVGPVTERWAPEQAGPVHENWQLAAPIGPATDLWALGALLFRAVQGHAPYPEENTAELVQLVCAEPPAFAEECGPLRPVVESLLRQDPTERLDFEELRGWLRSLVRSAPEPEAGAHVIAAPPVDPSRLPIVRRRGELVRRRRARRLPAAGPHARHKRARHDKQAKPIRPTRPTASAGPAKPRRLGRNLVLLVLLGLVAAVAYAMVFMPKAEPDSDADGQRTGSAGEVSPAPGSSSGTGTDGKASSEPRPDQTSPGSDGNDSPSGDPSSTTSQSNDSEGAQGFTLREDTEGFRVAVANGWDRTPKNGQGQVVYSDGNFELIVVPGRDSTATYGSDPLAYQRERESELQPFRDSTWATSSGMRRIDVGGRTMAEGQFTWQNSAGQELFVRNLAIILDGRYHVVQVRGPEAERDEVTRLYEQASETYQATG